MPYLIAYILVLVFSAGFIEALSWLYFIYATSILSIYYLCFTYALSYLHLSSSFSHFDVWNYSEYTDLVICILVPHEAVKPGKFRLSGNRFSALELQFLPRGNPDYCITNVESSCLPGVNAL